MNKKAVKNRLGQAYAFLRKYSPDITLSDLAIAMKLSPATVRNAIAPNTKYLTESFLDNFAETFGKTFSREWLFEGKKPVLVENPELPDPDLALRHQRVAYIIKRERLGTADFTRRLGLTAQSTMLRIVHGLTKPRDKTLRLILSHFPDYTERWLFLGLGPATRWGFTGKADRIVSREEEERVAAGDDDPFEMSRVLGRLSGRDTSTAGMYLPGMSAGYELTDDTASAGPFQGFVEAFPDESGTLYNIPVEKFHTGEYRLFRIKGVSMDNGDIMDLAHGDLVLARNIDRAYWRDGLHTHNWRYFVFVTADDGIVVKEVVDQDTAKDTYTLHSHNPEYPDFTLNGADIIAIYNVIQVVERRLNL